MPDAALSSLVFSFTVLLLSGWRPRPEQLVLKSCPVSARREHSWDD